MAEILSIVSIISFVIAGISFVLAVVFWFVFGIPSVIGDLSGRTARKSIAKMRENNEKSGNKSYRPSDVNAKREKLTDTMPDSGKLGKANKKKKAEDSERPETGILAENRAEVFEEQQTALLEDLETTGLLLDEEETAPLETVVQQSVKRVGGKKLVMLDEVMLVHTDEVCL